MRHPVQLKWFIVDEILMLSILVNFGLICVGLLSCTQWTLIYNTLACAGGAWGGVRPPNPVLELRRINTNAVNLVQLTLFVHCSEN